ncbi:MAG: ABC transporter permease [Chloroflexi bacterium]|nr:ABC transporter permease [Chloroflexota bacterium]
MIREETSPQLIGSMQATRRTRTNRVLLSLRQDRAGRVGLCVVLLVLFLAVAAPWVAPHDPLKQDLMLRLKPPAWVEGGSWTYPLGTDHLGRDLLSRIIFGSRISLLVGFSSVFVAGIFGTLMGLLAGFFRGRLDDLISRLIDIQLAVPYLLLAVALMMVLGSNLRNIIFVLVLYGWTVYARLVRAETFSAREREYVLAARSAGTSSWRIMLRHILPNVLNPVIIMATLEMANMIIFEAGLSFLGLGVQPPTPSWGGMLSDGRDYIPAGIWWPATFPGLAISLTILGINQVGDWLRDLLDPRTKL